MFIQFYTHDIWIFALNCNKTTLNIKLHVNIYLCEWMVMYDANIFCAYKYLNLISK
jgi:hypothetical protein